MQAEVLIVVTLCLTMGSGRRVLSKEALSSPMVRGGGKIVGGEDAAYGEFPHQVTLTWGIGGGLMCGGALVTADKVVTAAHCCDGGGPASEMGVEVGNWHLHSKDPEQKSIGVKMLHMHEDYDSWTVANDICVLDLAEEADLNSEVISTIELPSDMEEYEAGTDCLCTGWGATTHNGNTSELLQKVTVPVVSDVDCREAYGKNIFDDEKILDSMICAGFMEEGGKDSCQGDSGGPLMCGENLQLTGIVSWGHGCAEPGYPGVYTQTSYYIPWLAAFIPGL